MAKKIRLINRSTGFDSEKEKEVRLINPSTGFDSRNPATYGRDYEAEQKKETERANAKLAVRRAPKALSSRGSAGIAQMADRGMGNMSNLGRARNFEEYMQLRKEEEEAQGMQRAAEKLLAQNNTGTDVMFGKTEREREEEAQAAADLREMQYGYKRLGDKAVFATPFSPLPKSTKENTLTKAEAPAAFGITPYEYVNAMKTVDKGPQTSEEAKDFLDTYFWGNRMPTTEEYDAVYERLYNDPNVPDEEVRYFWWEGQRLLMEMENENREYDAAMSLLGENAEEYAGGTEADYLSRYMQPKIYGQISAQEAAERYQQEYEVPGIGQSFDEHDATMQSIMNRGKENPYSGTSLETGATLLQKEMSDEQAQTYMAIAQQYGEDAAQMYYDSLLKNGFNQRAYEIREEALREEANDAWFGSTLKTFLNVPGQVAGTMYSIGQGLKGEEIDPYDIAYMPSQAVQTPREEVSQMITNNYGKPDEETGEYKDTLWSWLMKAGYNAFTSGVDSRMSIMLGGKGAKAATALQGLWQMGGSVQDATLRGGDTEQALLYGGISAAVEAATEYLPMETLTKALESQNVKAFKDILKMALAGAVSEAPGEGLSELGNAIADDLIMQEMSRWTDAKEQLGAWGAAKQLAGDVLTSAFVGAISGAGSNTLAATGTYGVNRIVDRAVEKANAAAKPAAEQTAPVQPESQTVQQNTAEAAQESEQQGQTVRDEEGEGQKEKPVIGAEKGKNSGVEKNAAAATPSTSGEGKAATYSADGTDSKVKVLGVASVRKDGRIMVEVQTESGEREVVNAADVVYDDATTDELMAYGASERMDAKGLQTYLDSYDESMGTVEEYAKAFSSIYSRARSGMDFEQAALANSVRSAMTQDAMIAAYMAGEAQYMTENNVLNAKEQKFQKKMLNVLNRYAGGKITLTKQDIGGNALYNRQTGEILISTNAQRGAYAYYAVHELGHKLKAENAQQWTAFQELVMDALDRNGVDVSELMQHEAEKFEQNGMQYDDDLLLEEVICNNAAGILQDEAVVKELIQKDRSLMERVADWLREFIDKMSRAMQDAGRDMSELGSWQGLQALKDDHESLKAIYESLMKGLGQANNQQSQENVSDNNVVKMSAKEKEHYDFSKPFAEQVEDLFAGRFPEKNALMVSGTPEVLQKIGFSNLPMTINQEHLLNMGRDTEHYLNNEMIKQLPELMKDPIAIITSSSEENKKASIVMILKAIVNGKPYIAPVYITSESRSYNFRIDSNNVATVFRKGNAVSNMLENAVQKENAGEVGVYYWNKTEARNLYERAGVQFSGRSIQDGLIHSIFDAGSPVNVKFMEQTETRQFDRWFGNSQIANEDGSPKVMYHGTASEFWTFDKRKSNDLIGRRMGLGAGGGKFYLTEHKGSGNAAAYSAQQAGKGNQPHVMELYVSAQKVMDRSEYDRRLNELYAKYPNSDPRGEVYDYRQRDKAIAQLDKALRKEGYDGVWDKDSGELFVYESSQIKSATDNIGTFDPSNPDIRYSLRETDANIRSAVEAEEKAMMQVKAHRITAMEADKLAGKALQKANSDYDQQEVASRIARTIDLMERGEDVDMRQVDDEMTQLAADIMTKSRTLDLEHEERAKPVRDYLRTTAIRLTEGQRAEAESMSGSYGAYRKSMVGRVRLSGRGMMLDQAWQELNALDAEWFPANAREGDMPALLMAAVDESKPVYHNGMGMNVEESANWLAGQIMQAYFHLPAVQAAAKNARTFGDSVRDLVKAMKSFEETSWSEYQNSLQAIRSARNTQQRTKKQEETAAMRAKYQSWRERDTAARREREQASKYRGRIEAKTGSLLNWLEKPTETKHIPAAVEDSVRELLKTLNFTGKDTKVATELARRLEGIAKSMETAQNNEDGTMYFEQDQQMIDEIKTLAEKIGLTTDRQQMEGRGIYDLNSEELKDLDKWLGVIKHVLTDAGKLKGTDLAEYNSLDEVQGLSVMEIRQKTPLKDKRKALKAWEKYFGPDMMDSFTFFERLGPTATRVFMGLRSGFDENVRLLAIAEEYSKTLFAELKLEELTGKKAKKEKLKLSDGTEVEMTKGEMISIYLLSRRKQARGHMYKEEKGEGIKLASDEDPDPHVLTKADEEKIAGKLTKQEKRVADGMQRFLSRECAGWGNTASMKLLGYRKFVEEHYWPIRTDSSTHNSSRLEQNFDADINAVIHQGMTKQTVENANNAIVIEDAFDTFTRHISNMAAYSAYAVPMSDFNKWYGNTELKRAILKTMGPKGQEYIKNLIVAINGSRRAEERSGIERGMAWLNRNAKAASVGANARVIVQQPTSYARAAAYMSPKYLSKGMTKQIPDDALIYRYCPIARWKDWGFRETNVGPNLKELLTGKKTGMAWLQDKSMALAAKGDMWTMRRLWNACELETKALYGYKEGSEAYYRQVGKRMSELMDRTQVVDSVFHRSQMMRSKSWLAQTLTNFMSEPTKTFNLLVSATYEWAENRKNKAARARLARTYGVWVATAALTSAAAALVDAFRDDEDEKDWLEKYVSAFWDNTLESLRPSGMLPGVKEVLSIVQGYSPSRMDLQSVQRVMWAIDAVKKYIQGEGTQNLYGVVYKVAQAGSSFTGLPVSNVMRDINGVIQTYAGTSLTLKESSSEKRRQRVGMIYDALLEKDKATAQKQREALKNKGGATDKEIDTMLAEFLLDNPKVKEAWEAKTSGRIADANRARNALTVMGFPGEVVDKAVQRYGNKAAPKETKEKDPDEQLNVKLYTSTDAKNTVSMILNGTASEADLREIMSELAADSTAKDPQDSVRKSVQSALKEEYITLLKKGDAKARRMELILLNVVGTSQKTIDNWKKEAQGK